jgi:membrane protein DedA with SNARE-associated domain
MCLLYKYGLGAICFVVLIEYACFPVSSEIVLPFSGVVAHMNKMDLRVVIVMSIIAGAFGSSVCYFIGRMCGEKSLRWLEKKVPKSKNAILKSEEFFNRFGNLAVLIGRLIPLCRTYISFVAGIFKQSYVGFVAYSIIGITIWNTILITVGFWLGDKWERVGKWYSKYKFLVLAVLIIIILMIVFKRILRGKNIIDKEQCK